jgi:hypothetical protein
MIPPLVRSELGSLAKSLGKVPVVPHLPNYRIGENYSIRQRNQSILARN